MDDAGNLISDLLAKLAELDEKVTLYRKDMAAEFQRYSDDLLRDVPEAVSAEVNRAIAAASISGHYRSLYPDSAGRSTPTGGSLSPEPESPAIDRSRWDGRGPSPPPVLPHTSGVPRSSLTGSSPRDGPPRDPHAREREFHGLFTPSYLPLLESADRVPHSPPPAQPLPTVPVPPPLSETPQKPNESPTASPTSASRGGGGLVPRFPPVRSFTDPSTESRSGDDGGGARRSALRRSSSSSNRPSPRRVRFDFEGEEVLPTSPPEAPRGVVALPLVTTMKAASPVPASRDSFGPTLSLYDDLDQSSSPPKKVSSSQALRALSKLPLENPGTWTVVNPSADPATPLFEGTRPTAQPQAAFPPTFATNMTTRIPSPPDVEELENQSLATSQLGSPLQDLEAYDDASDSDDDYVSMPIRPGRKKSISPEKRSPLLPAAPSSPSPSPHSVPKSATGLPKAMPAQVAWPAEGTPASGSEVNGRSESATRNTKRRDRVVEDNQMEGEEFFEMDEDIPSGTGAKRDTQPYLEHDEELDADEETKPAASGPPENVETEVLSHSLTSKRPIRTGESGGSPPVPASVGSYKGRQIAFEVVKNPLVHQKAAELGKLDTFVGSIKDTADPSTTFRGGSLTGAASQAFTGTPRSLRERLMLEELVDQGAVPSRR